MTKVADGGEPAEDIRLPLEGRAVTRCYVDYAFSVQFLDPGDEAMFRIASSFELHQNGRRWTADPTHPEELGPALGLFGKIVAWAMAYHDGALEVLFTDGTRLCVSCDPDYEAWQFTGSHGRLIVSMPGGGLAIWGATTPR